MLAWKSVPIPRSHVAKGAILFYSSNVPQTALVVYYMLYYIYYPLYVICYIRVIVVLGLRIGGMQRVHVSSRGGFWFINPLGHRIWDLLSKLPSNLLGCHYMVLMERFLGGWRTEPKHLHIRVLRLSGGSNKVASFVAFHDAALDLGSN